MKEGQTRFLTVSRGQVAIEKKLQCVRCSASEAFSLPDSLLENINDDSLMGCTLIHSFAYAKGWLCAQVVQPGTGTECEFTLCPACVGADLACKHK